MEFRYVHDKYCYVSYVAPVGSYSELGKNGRRFIWRPRDIICFVSNISVITLVAKVAIGFLVTIVPEFTSATMVA